MINKIVGSCESVSDKQGVVSRGIGKSKNQIILYPFNNKRNDNYNCLFTNF
jgi:hypothetical protein